MLINFSELRRESAARCQQCQSKTEEVGQLKRQLDQLKQENEDQKKQNEELTMQVEHLKKTIGIFAPKL